MLMTEIEMDRLVTLLGTMPIRKFDYEVGDTRLYLHFESMTSCAPDPLQKTPEQTPVVLVSAPGMGVLRLVHPDQCAPFVKLGDAVRSGQILAFLQVGEVLAGVLSPQTGILSQVLRAEGDLIGYADPIFEIQSGD